MKTKKTLTAQFANHSETKKTTVDYKFAAEVNTTDPEFNLVFWSRTAEGAGKLADKCVADAHQYIAENNDDLATALRVQDRRAGRVVKVQELTD